MPERSRYIGTSDHPYHLSVGAVLVNEKNQIASHHYRKRPAYPDWPACYVLMRETVKNGESLEHALHRGLKEEFGATGRTVAYLGSLIGSFLRENARVEKTTLYFLVQCTSFRPQRQERDDPENGGTIEWHDADFYVPRMRRQSESRDDIDESAIILRAVDFL